MTRQHIAHTHTEYDPACFRCDLSRDEVADQHETPHPTPHDLPTHIGNCPDVPHVCDCDKENP